MAAVDVKNLSKAEHDELCCVYAALILQDEKMEISSEKLEKLLNVTKNKVEPYWPSLFAKALKGVNVMDLITKSAPVASSSAAVEAPKEKPKEAEKPKEEAPKEDDAPALTGLFGSDE